LSLSNHENLLNHENLRQKFMTETVIFFTLISANKPLHFMRLLRCFAVFFLFILSVSFLRAQEFSTTTQANAKANAQASVQSPSRTGWRILPVPSYAPETSLALTVGGLYYFGQPDGDSTSRLNQLFGGIQYTLRNQFVVSVLPEMYFNHENIRLFGQFEISRFPDFFYGIGDNLPESNREAFTIFRAAAIGSLWFSLNGQGIRNGINAGLRFDFDYQNIIERQAGGLLEREGANAITGRSGGLLAGLGLAVNYDTRDVAVCPREGGLIDARLVPYTRILGSNFEGWRGTVDIHKYFTFNKPTPEDNGFSHTLAIQWFTDITTGDIPFFRMGLLGQNISGVAIARGYFGGRFRGKVLSHLQAEYRFPIWWRFGGVLFAGTGNVAETPASFDFTGLKHSIGAGLRFALVPEERINLRIDVGYGFATQTFFPYVSFTEAF
jgi:hypothetical protein